MIKLLSQPRVLTMDWKRKQKINKLKLDQRLRDWNLKAKKHKDLWRTRNGNKRPTNYRPRGWKVKKKLRDQTLEIYKGLEVQTKYQQTRDQGLKIETKNIEIVKL
jgi:hypothetical protein